MSTVFNNITSTNRTLMEIVTFSTILFVIILLAVVGNITVIIVVGRTPSLYRNLSNWFIVNLAVSDISNALLVMLPSFVSMSSDLKTMSKQFCRVVCSTNYCLIIVSMYTMLFVGWDRYLAIKYALTYRQVATKSKIILALIFSWAQGIAFAVAPSAMDWVEYDYWESVCAINWYRNDYNSDTNTKKLYYVVIACIICFLVPSILLIVYYTFILRVVFTSGGNKVFDAKRKAEFKLIISLLLVLILFFVFMAPFCITKFFKVLKFNYFLNSEDHLSTASSILQYAASACNPFIYAIFREDMRVALRKICLKKSNRVSLELQNSPSIL